MEHRPYPPNAAKPPQSKFPWPLLALAIAVLLLVATLWLSPSVNRAASNKVIKNNPDQLELFSIRMSPQEANTQANVDVYGEVSNTGPQSVSNAIISAVFKDKDGHPLVTQQKPMQRMESSNAGAKSEDLSTSPLKAGETAEFRVSYTDIPQNWNHQTPQLSVQQVTARK
ncbi:MAG TPA: hypothetical protein VFP59_00300 [Candidatus Angelobacter sp.]|nr:hypothetical protein [Candidatus Angelobacter sp.]